RKRLSLAEWILGPMLSKCIQSGRGNILESAGVKVAGGNFTSGANTILNSLNNIKSYEDEVNKIVEESTIKIDETEAKLIEADEKVMGSNNTIQVVSHPWIDKDPNYIDDEYDNYLNDEYEEDTDEYSEEENVVIPYEA